MVFWNTWERSHNFGLQMPRRNFKSFFERWLLVQKLTEYCKAIPWHQSVEGESSVCLKIILNVVALRNYVTDTGTEASVGSETFLTLSIMKVYLREKSSKKIWMSDGKEELSCATPDVRLRAKFLEKSMGGMSSALDFSVLLESHFYRPWIGLCDFLKDHNLDSNLFFLSGHQKMNSLKRPKLLLICCES